MYVNKDLVYKTRALTWELKSQHNSYLQFNPTFKNDFLTYFIRLINLCNIC